MHLLSSNLWRRSYVLGSLWALRFSTRTASSSPTVVSLHSRIFQEGERRVSIIPDLNRWVEEGREVKQSEVKRLIKQLRNYRRFGHALELLEWMSNETNHDLSPGDIAIRLHLISKANGLEQAEEYFNDIPGSLRDFKVYGALLTCYAEHKSLEKAEATMQKMKELGFLNRSLTYNVMLSLYSHMGMHEKLDLLMEEMEERGIDHDRFTYNIRMNAYVSASDVTKMEQLLSKMEADPLVTMDWLAYLYAANGYLKAGQVEKCKLMLRKLEQLIRGLRKWFAYECLLTVYASIGSKEEVYRIWNSYLNLGKRINSGYLCMLSSLMKLDDIDGAEKILEEWESSSAYFDYKIPNLMISGYCKKGLLEKAEAYIKRLIENGREPNASTWSALATGYRANGEMAKAVETMKKSVVASQPGWKLNRYTLVYCLEFLKSNGNVEEAENILGLIKGKCILPADIYEKLESYINCENPNSSILDEIKQSSERGEAFIHV